jgi:hypothetical protein
MIERLHSPANQLHKLACMCLPNVSVGKKANSTPCRLFIVSSEVAHTVQCYEQWPT